MMLRPLLTTEPMSLCSGAGIFVTQDGSAVAVTRFSTKETGSDSKAFCTLVGTAVMRTDNADETPGSTTSDSI